MNPFTYRDGVLHAEGVSLVDLAARSGTPCFVYSRAAIESRFASLDAALAASPHLICYAVKANSNLAVLNVLARLGAGFDIVSVGELERALAAGAAADRIVFAGVGKRADEMRRALEAGIRCFNVESESELRRLDEVAGIVGRRARAALRVNPDVDPQTHPYIATGLRQSKFGIPMERAAELYRNRAAFRHVALTGLACHIGSQLTGLAPLRAALRHLRAFLREIQNLGAELTHVDVGGGLGIRYRDEAPPTLGDYAAEISAHFTDLEVELLCEPGRSLVGEAGLLLTRVEYLKSGSEVRDFAIVDAAMNDLIRPALYSAWQEVLPVTARPDAATRRYDIVGPICESGDFLARERELALAEGDLLAVMTAGAYGFAMSSNYNSRPRAAEVMVDGASAYLVRARESLPALFAGETVLP